MNRKKVLVLVTLLIFAAGLAMVKQNILYFSHEALASDEITKLLAETGQRLPREQVELTQIFPYEDTGDIPFARVASWQLESVKLRNVHPLLPSILDDDPIYRIDVGIRVAFEDGEDALLSWESWRYGIVLGPLMASKGDGPPGWIHTAVQTH